MQAERFTLRAAAYLLLIKDNKILIIRRYNTGWSDGEYSLIAGHLDGNETVLESMVREANEEAGITVKPTDLHIIHVMHRKSIGEDLEYIDFFVSADKWKGIPRITEKDKCDNMQWVPLNNLPQNVIPHVKQAIYNYKNKIAFSEFGF